MAEIIRKAYHGYQFVFVEATDPRTRDLPFVARPYQGLAIIFLYLMFVLKWGPNWMKNRPAFKLDKVLIVYNAFQVVVCFYLFVQGVWKAWGWKYKWVCEPVDYSNTDEAIFVTKIVYAYFLTKLLDLMDTVFFVLRKKFNQITFLHVYHHTGMVMLIWAACTYYPGGHGTLIGVINCFVHAVMYSYYLLTVATPRVKQFLWFKKHITQLQILQFFCTVVHMSTLVFQNDCAYPRWIAAVFLPQNLFMLLLFLDFYIKAYVKKPAASPIKNGTTKNGASSNNGAKANCSSLLDHTNGNKKES